MSKIGTREAKISLSEVPVGSYKDVDRKKNNLSWKKSGLDQKVSKIGTREAKRNQFEVPIGSCEDHTESPETCVLHGGALSLVSYDLMWESGTKKNLITQIIAEDKRQVPGIMQFVVEISFCKSAVKSLKQSHKVGSKTKASQKLSCLKQGHLLAN